MDITNAEPDFQAERITQTGQAQSILPVELLSVSIEEVMERASATTQVLKEIIMRDFGSRYSCHWGINE